MKFVYLGYDFMLGTVERLIRDGHELIGIFTFPCDNIFNFNNQTQELATKFSIPFVDTAITADDIQKFTDKGATCFLAAGYPYKIPTIEVPEVYGVNVHPSLLPKGRGIMPSPHILMHAPEAAGVTAHVITDEFDAGDILDQVALPLDAKETVETYSARVAITAPDMVSGILGDLDDYVRLAKPQDKTKATVVPPPDEAMRRLSWADSIEICDAKARAFGRYGCLADITGQQWVIYDHDIWSDPDHSYPIGAVVLKQPRHIVIAVSGGFFVIKDGHALA